MESFVGEHLGTSFDLADMAKVVSCDQFRFARDFSKLVGVTPHRYVMRKRVERACQLIAGRKLSLSQIAAVCGFTDQSHLNRWMKRIVGVTPGELVRSRNRKNIQDNGS